MKKTYQKPKCEIEHFALTSSISGCGLSVHNTDGNCVKYVMPDPTLDLLNLVEMGFFMGGCEIEPNSMEDFDGICVHSSVAPYFGS